MAESFTRGNSVAGFFESYLHHTKGAHAGEAFLLEPWQREFVDEFYSVDEHGDRLYRLGVLGIPRGNGKSPLAAGFGLFELCARKDSPDIFCVAGAKDQAQVVINYARDFVETGPLEALLKPSRRAILYEQTHGVMRVLSSAGSLQFGLSVSAAIADELWAFRTQEQEDTWTSLWTALHKRPNSFALAITTAGYDKRSLLGKMYDNALALPDGEDRPCLRIRRDRENGVLFYWYGIPEAQEDDWENPELWRAANPASWVDIEELRKNLHGLDHDEFKFKRYHLNMWTKARDSWLPPGIWSGLGVPALEPPERADIYIGVDVGWSHDSTAVAWATRFPDGKIGLWAKVWTTVEGELGEYVRGGKMRLELVEEYIRQLAVRYRLRELSYDPKYFGRSAEDLEREGIVTVEMLPASAPMSNAWQAFYQAAMEGQIAHDGDKVLAAHVEAAAADASGKVRKLKATSRIDALAAAVMAHGRCELKTRRGKAAPQILWLGPGAEYPED